MSRSLSHPTEPSASERHPFEPFLPEGARLLMLGTFPPSPRRWAMAFYYPNLQNDMWRIAGLCFFGDKHHFLSADGRHYREAELRAFLQQQGIALYDTCTSIVRTCGTASDKDLQVVEETDLRALLRRLPCCTTVVTAGQLATTIAARQLGTTEPATGDYADCVLSDAPAQRHVRLYRMPSSSRAYPLAVERKAEAYARAFQHAFGDSPVSREDT